MWADVVVVHAPGSDRHHYLHALIRRETRNANAKCWQPRVLYEFAGGLSPFSTDRTAALLIGNCSARIHNAIDKIELNLLCFAIVAICIPKKTPAHFCRHLAPEPAGAWA